MFLYIFSPLYQSKCYTIWIDHTRFSLWQCFVPIPNSRHGHRLYNLRGPSPRVSDNVHCTSQSIWHDSASIMDKSWKYSHFQENHSICSWLVLYYGSVIDAPIHKRFGYMVFSSVWPQVLIPLRFYLGRWYQGHMNLLL